MITMVKSRAATIKEYGNEIDGMVRVARKWISDTEPPPSDEEILCKCEDMFFKSGISYKTCSRETVIIIDSINRRLTSRYGILTVLLDDPDINEIMVNGPDNIYVEKERTLIRIDDAFTCANELEEMIRMFASDVHREINEANPIVDARLPSGYRVNGVLKNVALNGPILTIRKFREKEIEMEELVSFETLTKECAHIENKVQLECRAANSIGKGEVSMTQLIRTSLRMRPDRIIVGEVRGKEVIDMIQAMNTGHDGSMSTGHGNSIRGMLNRLETMYLSDSQVSLNSVRNQIANAIDIFVHLRRDATGRRRVVEVAEMIGFYGNEYRLNYLYKTGKRGALIPTGNGLVDRERLIRCGHAGILAGPALSTMAGGTSD